MVKLWSETCLPPSRPGKTFWGSLFQAGNSYPPSSWLKLKAPKLPENVLCPPPPPNPFNIAKTCPPIFLEVKFVLPTYCFVASSPPSVINNRTLKWIIYTRNGFEKGYERKRLFNVFHLFEQIFSPSIEESPNSL